MKIAISVVSYGDQAHVAGFVEGVLSAAEGNSALTLVACVTDNSHRFDSSSFEILTDRPNVAIHHRRDNPGYFASAFRALANVEADWYIVCNADIDFDLAELVSVLGTYDAGDALVIGGEVHDSDSGRRQPCLDTRPTIRHQLALNVVLVSYAAWSVVERLRQSLIRQRERPETDLRRVFAPHGSFQVVSRSALERDTSVLEECRLYTEEVTLGLWAERSGVQVWCEPSLRISHRSSQSTGLLGARARHARLRKGVTINSLALVKDRL